MSGSEIWFLTNTASDCKITSCSKSPLEISVFPVDTRSQITSARCVRGATSTAPSIVTMFASKNIVGTGFIVNLPELKGELKLKKAGIDIHSVVEF